LFNDADDEKKGVKLTLDVGALAGVPRTVKGVMFSVTVVNPVEARGALRMYPCSTTVPKVAAVSFTKGRTAGNFVVVGTSNGKVCVYPTSDMQLYIDVYGWII
jgi:hypothetical protein